MNAKYTRDLILTDSAIWVDARAYSTIADAVAAISNKYQTLLITESVSSTNLTIHANTTLKFTNNGFINDSGTLTINTKDIISKDRQIFSAVTNIVFATGSIIRSPWLGSDLAINQSDITILIPSDTVTTTSLSTIDSNIIVEDGGQLLIDEAVTVTGNLESKGNTSGVIAFDAVTGVETLTINGGLNAGLWQVFGDSISVSLSDNSVSKVLPWWFGGYPGASGSINRNAIISALTAAAGKPVLVTNGTWSIDNTISYTGYVYLEGEDWQKSIISISTDNDLVLHDNDSGGLTIKDITLTSSVASNNYTSVFVHIDGFIHTTGANLNDKLITVEHCRILMPDYSAGNKSVGIYAYDGSTPTYCYWGRISNCMFSYLDCAIHLSGVVNGSSNAWKIVGNDWIRCLMFFKTTINSGGHIVSENRGQPYIAALGHRYKVAYFLGTGNSVFGDNITWDLSGDIYDYFFRAHITDLNNSDYFSWVASSSGTDEYYVRGYEGYYGTMTQRDPLISLPSSVNINSVGAVKGVMGSLAVDQWDYGDNDSLGYDTIYVRLSGGADPNVQVSNYIEYEASDVRSSGGYRNVISGGGLYDSWSIRDDVDNGSNQFIGRRVTDETWNPRVYYQTSTHAARISHLDKVETIGGVHNKANDYTLLKSDSHSIFTNEGAGVSITFTLPTLEPNTPVLEYTFVRIRGSGYGVEIDPGALNYIGFGQQGDKLRNMKVMLGTYSSVTIRGIATDRWVIIGSEGWWEYTSEELGGGVNNWLPGAIGNGTEVSFNCSISGAQMGDFALASISCDPLDLSLTAAVTAENVVTISLLNNTGGAVTLNGGNPFDVFAHVIKGYY